MDGIWVRVEAWKGVVRMGGNSLPRGREDGVGNKGRPGYPSVARSNRS